MEEESQANSTPDPSQPLSVSPSPAPSPTRIYLQVLRVILPRRPIPVLGPLLDSVSLTLPREFQPLNLPGPSRYDSSRTSYPRRLRTSPGPGRSDSSSQISSPQGID